MLELDQLLQRLACPRDKSPLTLTGSALPHTTNEIVCQRGHRYPVVDGVPVLLLQEVELDYRGTYHRTLKQARGEEPLRDYPAKLAPGAVDPYVQVYLGSTCGRLYTPAHGKLEQHPFPEIELPDADGATLLDLGSNWGRWSVAAARKGYDVIGMDPDLEGIRAARRIAVQQGVSSNYIVADARHLPFPEGAFDIVYSFSVLQHLPKEHVRQSLAEVHRVLKPSGRSLIQMASLTGVRSLYNYLRIRWKRGFKGPAQIDVRHWTWRELHDAFGGLIGPTRIRVDSFLSLNIQPADLEFMLPWHQRVVRVAQALEALSRRVPGLKYLADSVFVESSRDER